MGQQSLDEVALGARRRAYRRLVETQLPARARAAGDWPVAADHCFARVVLDGLFGDVWYDHVDGRPAHAHLSAAKLEGAIRIGTRLLREGRPAVATMNRRSLRYRGERPRTPRAPRTRSA